MGENIKLKWNFKVAESIFLIIVFFVSLLIVGDLFDNKLSHDFPHGYYASDCFWHQSVSQYIKDVGKYKTQPPYMSMGFDDIVGFNPPILYHLAPILSYATGLEVYDTIYLLAMIFICLGFIIFYLINKRLSKHIAILSIPLFIFMFVKSFPVSFTWGQWILVTGSFFLIVFFWSMCNLELKKSWIIIGIFLSALALSHTSEFIFAIGFIAIYLSLKFILFRKIDFNEIKKLIIAGIVSLILSIYYLIIFKFTWGKSGYHFYVNINEAGFRIAWLADFGFILIALAIGFIFWLFIIKKKYSPTLLIPIYMLGIGYTNYIGFGNRAFQTRFFWPIYLSLFLGLVLYYILKVPFKKINPLVSIIISILLILSFKGTYYQKISSAGIMNPYHWEVLNWVKENTPEDSRVYYFYGDIYGQNALLWNSKRVPVKVNTNGFVEALNNRTIKREYSSAFASASDNGFPYRKSLFSFGSHTREEGVKKSRVVDICQFDFFVLDKVSGQQVLAQYNMIIRDQLLKKEFISEVFNNEVSSILFNEKPGEECINEQRIE